MITLQLPLELYRFHPQRKQYFQNCRIYQIQVHRHSRRPFHVPMLHFLPKSKNHNKKTSNNKNIRKFSHKKLLGTYLETVKWLGGCTSDKNTSANNVGNQCYPFPTLIFIRNLGVDSEKISFIWVSGMVRSIVRTSWSVVSMSMTMIVTSTNSGAAAVSSAAGGRGSKNTTRENSTEHFWKMY